MAIETIVVIETIESQKQLWPVVKHDHRNYTMLIQDS